MAEQTSYLKKQITLGDGFKVSSPKKQVKSIKKIMSQILKEKMDLEGEMSWFRPFIF
jgi:hypothetical protein